MDGYDNNNFDNNGFDADNNFDNNGFGSNNYDTETFDSSGFENNGYDNYGSDNTGYETSASQFGINQEYNTAAGFEGIQADSPETDQPILNIPSRSNQTVDADSNFAESTESTLNSLGVEPTQAEIADMKRERAARRRKQLLREKRRKERQRQAIIRCSLLLAAVILVIFILVKIFTGIGGLIKNAKKNNRKTTEAVTTEATTTEEPVAQIDDAIVAKDIPETREEALNMLKEQAETNSDIKNIVENEAVYPDIVLEHLAVNSELIDFTLFYPAQISIPFDGDFTVEADTSEVPLFLEYDSRWAYADYGATVLGLNGTAPTCLSMAYVYLTGDGSKNPIIIGDFSMEKGYLDEQGHTDYKLMKEGAEELGLESAELDMSKDNLIAALEEGNAVICAVLPGDFTRDKSFIVIKSYRNGLFYVNDPASNARSEVGWDYKRLSNQISTMWSLKRGTESVSTDDGTDDSGTTDGTDGGTTDGTSDGGTTDGTTDGATGDNSTDGTDGGTN